MFKAIIPAVVLAASLCSVAHADQEDTRVSQQQAAQVQQLASATPAEQAPGLTRAQVYNQLVQAEQDGALARLNATTYRGH
jgi:lipase chaperone LimK